jgi:hypothetical protein
MLLLGSLGDCFNGFGWVCPICLAIIPNQAIETVNLGPSMG